MAKEKKRWTNFKKIFSKAPNKTPPPPIHPTSNTKRTKRTEVFVIEPTEEETFKVGTKSKEVFVIEPAQGETFILESTEEETVEFNAEQTSNDIFVIEPTKEYETLGLDPDATDAEVKTRYRELLKEHHPDMGGDPKNFMKIRKAYLKIMESRAEGES